MVENHAETDKSALDLNGSKQPPKKDDKETEGKGLEKSPEVSSEVINSQLPHGALEKHPTSRSAADPNLVSSYGNKCYC